MAEQLSRVRAHRPSWAVAALWATVLGLTACQAATPAVGPSPAPGGRSTLRPAPAGVSAQALRAYRWRALPAAPIAARTSTAAVWTGSRLLVWGGEGADHSRYADGAAYDPATRRWTRIPAAPLSGRAGAQAVWLDGSLVVWGGVESDEGRPAADGARYDPTTRVWTRLPPAPVTSFGWARLVVAAGRAVLVSTSVTPDEETVRADVYDPARNTWQALPDLPGQRGESLYTADALGTADAVLVWRYWSHTTTVATHANGVETTTTSGQATYRLDPASGRWGRAADLDADPGRQGAQPLWTGRQVVVPDQDIYCGPCSHPMSLDRPGFAVDPSTGRRIAIPSGPVSVGQPRYVWTGRAVVGLNLSASITQPGGIPALRPGDLAAWDPGSDRWISLPRSTFRGVLDDAVVVWAGDRLLVWGVRTAGAGGAAGPAVGLTFGPG